MGNHPSGHYTLVARNKILNQVITTVHYLRSLSPQDLVPERYNIRQTLCNSSFLKTLLWSVAAAAATQALIHWCAVSERNKDLCVVKVFFKKDPKASTSEPVEKYKRALIGALH